MGYAIAQFGRPVGVQAFIFRSYCAPSLIEDSLQDLDLLRPEGAARPLPEEHPLLPPYAEGIRIGGFNGALMK